MSDERRFAARARLHVIGDNLDISLDAELRRGEQVLVETKQGREVATLIEDAEASQAQESRPEGRRLTERDHEQLERMNARELDALTYARSRAHKLKLELKFISAKLTHDGKFATFYFSAPERVDFRTLVKDLAKRFSMRVEMRQIGVRDAARQVGGIGLCGRKLCCETHLPSFKPISIRLAKDQGLALNQQKLSGACGRLRCCLQYEHEVYSKALKSMPKLHKRVTTPHGIGKVRDLNILTGNVSVVFDDGEQGIYRADEVERYIPPNQPKGTKPQEPKAKSKPGRRSTPNRQGHKGEDNRLPTKTEAPKRSGENEAQPSQDPTKKARRRRRPKSKGAQPEVRGEQHKTSSPPRDGKQTSSAEAGVETAKKRRRRRRKPKNKDGTPTSNKQEPST